MAVPDYQTLMLPVLESLADGSTRSTYGYGVGVRTRRSLDVKRVDEAYVEGDV